MMAWYPVASLILLLQVHGLICTGVIRRGLHIQGDEIKRCYKCASSGDPRCSKEFTLTPNDTTLIEECSAMTDGRLVSCVTKVNGDPYDIDGQKTYSRACHYAIMDETCWNEKMSTSHFCTASLCNGAGSDDQDVMECNKASTVYSIWSLAIVVCVYMGVFVF